MNAETSLKTLLVSALALSVSACGVGSEADDADDAVATTSATSSESALMSSAAEESTAMPATMTSDDVAEGARLRLIGKYTAGCVTATRNLNVVTYVLVNCTGPYGLVTVSGTLVVTYTRQADGSIRADGSGTGLKVNSGTLDVAATAVYTRSAAGLETAVVDSKGRFVGPKGHTGDRTGNYTVTRDQAAGCVTLDGSWSTRWDGTRATTSTQVAGLKKCAGECPAAGGVITHTGVLGKVLTIKLDGSAVAQWSSTSGRSGTANLQCK